LVIDRVTSSSLSSFSFLSIRSVTWVVVSSTVAPGSAAVMTMVLMAKLGSSSRPIDM
jgi:hypothetical protein